FAAGVLIMRESLASLFAVVALAIPLLSVQAHAGPKTYVSSNGTDAGSCTLAAPCRTLQFAHDQTTFGGEIGCISPYDTDVPITINRGITIDCGSSQNSFIDDGLGGIAINANSPINVTIRNLRVFGMNGVGSHPGINFVNGGALFVEHCIIEGWTAGSALGINFAPSGFGAQLHVRDSIIRNNGNGSTGGGAI